MARWFHKTSDPVAQRISAATKLDDLAAVFRSSGIPVRDWHFELGLVRWFELAHTSPLSNTSPAEALASFVLQARTPEQVLAIWALDHDVYGPGLLETLASNGRSPFQLMQLLPVGVVADLFALDTPRHMFKGPSLAGTQLLEEFQVPLEDLHAMFATVCSAFAVVNPDAPFAEAANCLLRARSAHATRPAVVLTMVKECDPRLARDRMDASMRLLEGLALLTSEPSLVDGAQALERAGAPGSLLTLMEAARCVTETSNARLGVPV
jgi:hypothetical protein